MSFATHTVSIAANVCATDAAIIRHTIPSWIRVFGEKLLEVLLVVDESPPMGRMLEHHKQSYSNDDLYFAIQDLEATDVRIKHKLLDYDRLRELSLKWFNKRSVLRCQSGSPIFGYIYAIEKAAADVVMRLDCDMLFFEQGWVERAIGLLESGEVDLLEPPKLGMRIHPYSKTISTGAFLVKRSHFLPRCLPIKPHKLDWLRQVHRSLHNRPRWLSLEEMFLQEKNRGRIRHVLMDDSDGFSVHVWSREYVNRHEFPLVVSAIERGRIPEGQGKKGWNLALELWHPDELGDLDGSNPPSRPKESITIV